MEQVDLINRIIEAEQKAQEMAAEARAKRQSLPEDIRKSRDELRKDFFDRAQKRIDEVRLGEEKAAQDTIDSLAALYDGELSEMENKFSAYREQWIDKLFSLIVGR